MDTTIFATLMAVVGIVRVNANANVNNADPVSGCLRGTVNADPVSGCVRGTVNAASVSGCVRGNVNADPASGCVRGTAISSGGFRRGSVS